MNFIPLILNGAYIIEPQVVEDERGWFYRFFSSEEFSSIGHDKPWVHLNHSYTKAKGSIRGLHFQNPPHAEIKMVKCVRGKIMDLIVDLRQGSATFLNWVGIELSEENRRMLYIPEGFAHGFQTITDHCELIYHHTAPYVKEAEGGIRWNDPMVGIQWPLAAINISMRDQQHPLLTTEFKGIKI